MNKILVTATMALSVLSLAGCTGSGAVEGGGASAAQEHTSSAQQMVNPWVDCATANQAAQVAGFDFTPIENVSSGGVEITPVFRAVSGSMIEAIYDSGNAFKLTLRKGVAGDIAEGADITGDYNEYDQDETVVEGDLEIRLRGKNDFVYNATWTKGDYAYGISSETGMPKESILGMVGSIAD